MADSEWKFVCACVATREALPGNRSTVVRETSMSHHKHKEMTEPDTGVRHVSRTTAWLLPAC